MINEERWSEDRVPSVERTGMAPAPVPDRTRYCAWERLVGPEQRCFVQCPACLLAAGRRELKGPCRV